jgi:NitT/TauT family transport system permease protein
MRIWLTRLHLPTLAIAALLVAVWWALSWRYSAYVLPSPAAVLRGLSDVVVSGEIWRHTGASLGRIAVGFGGAVLVAVLLGLLVFVSRVAGGVVRERSHRPQLHLVFVWIVISIIWFGLSNWAPIFTTFMITLPVVAPTSRRAWPARIAGCSRWATSTGCRDGGSSPRSWCPRRCPTWWPA